MFDRLLGVLPAPLFDTQIAAAMAGLDFSMSYQRLVDDLLQIHVPKGETRSNWLQRPLTASQIHYAALDVAHLHEVYRVLVDKLNDHKRLPWCLEECAGLADKFMANGDVSAYYLKVKSGWKLTASQLASLKPLIEWREQQARERNVPRGRVLKDQVCFAIAQQQVTDCKALLHIDDMPPKAVRKDGDTIVAIVKESLQLESGELPARLPKPLPPEQGKILKALKGVVRARAEQLGVPTEILVKKKDYDELLRSGMGNGKYSLPPSLQGWRSAVIGKSLLETVQESNQ